MHAMLASPLSISVVVEWANENVWWVTHSGDVPVMFPIECSHSVEMHS